MENISAVTVFTLSGLNETMDYRVTLFSLTLLCYCVILLVNVTLIVTIILDENLHDPMYILLCNLCFNSIYGTAGFYPKLLIDLLSNVHIISYAGCMLQTFVIYSYGCCELSTLALMAYDRYVAICRPLQYHTIMTKKRLFQLIGLFWFSPLFCMTVVMWLSSRLMLCGSHIQKLYCDNWSIVKLACNSVTTNNVVGYIVILFFFGHGLFFVCSYFYVIKSCLKSLDSRVKFMQTSVPHLLCLINVIFALLFDLMYSRYGSRNITQDVQNFMAVEFLVVPPIFNPIIYGLKLTKVRNRILSLLR
ncbi:olfactory receptor 2K2-like [Aplochiton taeniatus]